MKKYLIPSLRTLLFMTLVLGLFYPVLITFMSQVIFPKEANGSLVYEKENLVGSELIAQNFQNEKYFWPRPSAVSYNPLPSGGSNLGPISKALHDEVQKRKVDETIPKDLLYTSGSGLDPHISPEAASDQVSRVAKARGLSVEDVQKLVRAHIAGRQLGLLGEETVNVLALNRSLDKMILSQNP